MVSASAVITIEIIYAQPQQTFRQTLSLSRGSQVKDALNASRLWLEYPHFEAMFHRKTLHVGIFGKHCTFDNVLKTGDRLEIYRLITCDPKKVRKALVKKR